MSRSKSFSLLLGLAATLSSFAALSSSAAQASAPTQATTNPAAAIPKKVLIVRKKEQSFVTVYEQVRKELSGNYEVNDMVVEKDTSYEEFKSAVAKANPGVMLLMDNQPVNFAIKYNSEQKEARKKVKGVAIMGLNFKYLLKGNPDIAGIAYELPPYSLLTQFRYVVDKPVRNVLVLYRKSQFQDTIDSAAKALSKEGFTLHPVDVESEGKDKVAETVKAKLPALAADSSKYDVVWVMLDPAMLTQELFTEVWIPTARKSKLPFVCGTDKFVSKEMNFGTFAITPNLPDLASQASQMAEMILTGEQSPGDIGVEELISVNKTLNLSRAQALDLKVKSENLTEVVKVE